MATSLDSCGAVGVQLPRKLHPQHIHTCTAPQLPPHDNKTTVQLKPLSLIIPVRHTSNSELHLKFQHFVLLR